MRHEINKRTITKRIVQAVAVAFGLLGLMDVFMGCHFAVMGIRESDRFALLSMAPWFLLLGGICVTIA